MFPKSEDRRSGDQAPVPHADILITPIAELATPLMEQGAARGSQMQNVKRIKNAALAISGKDIVAVGSSEEVAAAVSVDSTTVVIDASNNLVTPGLVDSHTHLIFDGDRANEFLMRCQGKSYAEIASAGGGIVNSMRATRAASKERLCRLGRQRLARMLENGTTTCEVKTGYGLSQESEVQMLEAIYELSESQAIELVPTFLPAHAVPPGVAREAYVEEITSTMLPKVRELCKSRSWTLPFVDVFCDQGYFTLEDTRKIFQSACSLGFPLKVHSDEFANLGATTLAAEMNAASADHLLNVSPEEMKMLSNSETVAVLLPGTSFYLNLEEHAPARALISSGAAVALGSDFNPGSCHIFSLTFIWGLACLHLKMTAEEALTALTCNAAYAVGKGNTLGQLRPGYQADIAIYDVQALEEVPYNLGWNPIVQTIKRGVVAYSA